jgi:hypothetical protein
MDQAARDLSDQHNPEVPLTALGEVVVAEPTGAVRANGAKPRRDLLPPEVLFHLLPLKYHPFIQWFHGSDPFNAGLLDLALHGLSDSAQQGAIELAEVLTMGAKKYEPRNWEKGLCFSGLFSSAIGHALKAQYEDLDEESGLAHMAHYAWGVMACYVFTVRGRTDLDDRPAVLAAKAAP